MLVTDFANGVPGFASGVLVDGFIFVSGFAKGVAGFVFVSDLANDEGVLGSVFFTNFTKGEEGSFGFLMESTLLLTGVFLTEVGVLGRLLAICCSNAPISLPACKINVTRNYYKKLTYSFEDTDVSLSF